MFQSLRVKVLTASIAIASCSLGAFVANTNPALADRYHDQIAIQLGFIADKLESYGFHFDRNIVTDDLGNRGTEVYSMDLRKGEDYVIIGVCDEDCVDLDLKVYDDNGNLIASDNDTDSTPMVQITPRWSAGFTLKAEMADCRNNPCRYGFGVMAR
jgi:hypothetical protein